MTLSAATSRKGGGLVELKQNAPGELRPDLKTIFAAELFSKLSETAKDEVIEQIKALLSREQ